MRQRCHLHGMPTNHFLTVEELAERWHTTVGGLHQMRHRGNAPAGHKIGRRILFRLDDVEAFEASRREVVAR